MGFNKRNYWIVYLLDVLDQELVPYYPLLGADTELARRKDTTKKSLRHAFGQPISYVSAASDKPDIRNDLVLETFSSGSNIQHHALL